MTDVAYSRKPLRMSFTNMNNGRTLEAQFNPDELDEMLQASYNQLTVLGMSHQPLQYSHTENHTFDFTLAFDAFDAGGGACVTNDPDVLGSAHRTFGGREGATFTYWTQNRLPDIMLARNYLLSLFYPPEGAQDVSGGAPPRFLFVWPNLISLTCRITRCRIKHTRFNLKGQPTFFTAELTITEVRDQRLHSDEVFYGGTFRHALPEDTDASS